MRYKINVPKGLFHETIGLMGDLGLFRWEMDEKLGTVYIDFSGRDELERQAYLNSFTKLLGPAGLTFEPAEEAPAVRPKTAKGARRPRKR